MNEATNPPPLKREPRYGYYPQWPQDGDDWLHPEDVELARRSLPSPRIWRREGQSGVFHIIRYGDQTLRVKPALWQESPAPAYQIGDWVEVRTRMMKNTAHTGRVVEVMWDDYQSQITYHIQEQDNPIPNAYTADDLKPVEPTIEPQFSRIESDTPEATDGVDELVEGLPKDENFRQPPR